MACYTFHILMGLPGSGKTYFGSSFNQNQVHGIYLDIIPEYYKSVEEYIELSTVKGYNRYETQFYVDGLILTKNDLKKIISIIYQLNSQSHFKFVIHHWKEDREACLNNDRYRCSNNERLLSSEITIKEATYNYIDDNSMKEIFDEIIKLNESNSFEYEIVYHDIFKVTNFENIINKHAGHNFDGKLVICGEEWSLGGTWGDCWGNEGTCSADVEPDFVQFDNFLEELCPNISFMQYKKLYNRCVETETWYESDYYGGSTEHARKICNIEKLRNALKEFGIETKE